MTPHDAALIWIATNLAIAAANVPIGTWTATDPRGTDTLSLYEDRGDCPPVARRAVYDLRGAIKINGCYIVREGTVFILFDDGDRVKMPTKAVTWKRGHAPADL